MENERKHTWCRAFPETGKAVDDNIVNAELRRRLVSGAGPGERPGANAATLRDIVASATTAGAAA